MKRALAGLGIAVVAIAIVVAVISLVASRDSGQVTGARGPGVLEPDRGNHHVSVPVRPVTPPDRPPTSGPHRVEAIARDGVALSDDQILSALELGNVVLAYDGDKAPLVALRDATAGPFSADLAAAGQAVILDRRPGVHGVIALAWRRRLTAASAGDPQLRAFIDAWLGQGPSA